MRGSDRYRRSLPRRRGGRAGAQSSRQTLNDSPHPQASLTLGLLNLNPSFRPSRAKSSSVPSRYGRLFGSITTLTPWLSNCRSSGETASAYSSLYAMPEQPVVRTPRRSATPLPRLARKFCTCVAAFSVSVTAMLLVLLLVVLDRGLDRVFGQDRAVDLH